MLENGQFTNNSNSKFMNINLQSNNKKLSCRKETATAAAARKTVVLRF